MMSDDAIRVAVPGKGDGVGHMLIVVGLYTMCVSGIMIVSVCLIVSAVYKVSVVVVVGESLL